MRRPLPLPRPSVSRCRHSSAQIELGKWAKQHSEITQEMIDEQRGKLTE